MGGVRAGFDLRLDPLSATMILVVTGVGALVMLYCRWYFRDKTTGVGQFSAVLLAFAGAMYGLVLTDDLRPSPATMEVIRQLNFPVLLAAEDSYEVASKVHDIIVKTRPDDAEKIAVIRDLIAQHVDVAKLVGAL